MGYSKVAFIELISQKLHSDVTDLIESNNQFVDIDFARNKSDIERIYKDRYDMLIARDRQAFEGMAELVYALNKSEAVSIRLVSFLFPDGECVLFLDPERQELLGFIGFPSD